MKEFQVCGMGNALVDLFVEISDNDIATLGFERGTMRLVDAEDQKLLLEKFASQDPRLVSGGSVGNSIIAFAQLGGKSVFLCCVGDDRYGLHYEREFEHLQIEMGNPVIVNQPTGTCVSLITPDAERTMRTCLGVATHLSEAHIKHDRELIEKSAWLFVEGYLFANQPLGPGAVAEAVKICKDSGGKVAITCSDAFIVHVFGKDFHPVLKQADLLFCNASEACAIANAPDATTAFQKMKDFVPNCVVTDGPDGAYIRWEGKEYHAPAFPCEPKDLTGAGDMFAGAFLYGVTHGVDPLQSAKAANLLAMKVITQVGARLHHGVREFWHQGIHTA